MLESGRDCKCHALQIASGLEADFRWGLTEWQSCENGYAGEQRNMR
jgi:hypothetical protein